MTTASVTSPGKEPELQILDAARDLMADGGLGALSMRAVADRVGVSATALYHYFDGKQDLVNRVVRGAFARFGEYMESAMRAHPKGSLDRVTALGEAYIRFAMENQAYFRVIFSIQIPDPRDLEELPGGGGYPLLRQAVIDAMDGGTMCQADPDVVSLFLWSTVHGLITLVLACRLHGRDECGAQPSPLDLFQAFHPFVRDGLLARVANGAPGDRDTEVRT